MTGMKCSTGYQHVPFEFLLSLTPLSDTETVSVVQACGNKSDVDMRHKLNTFILKNPPEEKMSKAEKRCAHHHGCRLADLFHLGHGAMQYLWLHLHHESLASFSLVVTCNCMLEASWMTPNYYHWNLLVAVMLCPC